MNRSLTLVAFMTLAGCSILPSPHRPQYDFVVLSSTDSARSPIAAHPSVTIDAVHLPNYLDRIEVVTRSSENQVEFSPRERWAESLAVAVPRILARDLDVELAGRFPAARNAADPRNEFSAEVQLDRFERTATTSELRAHWTLRHSGETAVRVNQLWASDPLPVGTITATEAAASLSRLLQTLAKAIAADTQPAPTAP